jgi:hypothetical protein
MKRGLMMACLLSACGEPATPAADATEHAHLRDDARLVLESYCGQCHIHEYETSLPRALAVFDLSELEWSGTMSDTQLEDARGRVRDRRGPDGPLPITDEEVARVEAFVAHELAHRAAQPTGH